MKTRLVSLIGLLLTGALPSSASASTKSALDPKELLHLAYPNAKIEAPEGQPPHIASIDLPNVKWPWLPKPDRSTTSDTDSTTVAIEPLNVGQIDAQHAVLITSAEPLYPDGESRVDTYGALRAIGVYFFTQTSSGWNLTARMESAVPAYSSDSFKINKLQPWPGHGLLFSLPLPFSAQGYANQYDLLLGLEPDRMTFHDELPMHWDNLASGCDDGAPKDQSDDADQAANECSSSTGQWRIVGNEIRVTYKDSGDYEGSADRSAPSNDESIVRLAPHDGKLQVLSGKLPEFGI